MIEKEHLYFPKIIDYGWLNFSKMYIKKESRMILPTKQTFL